MKLNIKKLKTKLRTALRNQRHLVISFSIIVLVVLILIFNFIKPDRKGPASPETPATPYTVETSEYNVHKDIVPGITEYSKVKEEFEPYIRKELKGGLDVYTLMKYEILGYPYRIGVDGAGKVSYIHAPIQSLIGTDDLVYIDEFLKQEGLGNPSMTKHHNYAYFVDKAHIFLDEGVVVSYDEYNKNVTYVTYFVPMPEDEFLKTLGYLFSNEPKGHSCGPSY